MATPAQHMLSAVLAGHADTVAVLLDADAKLANLTEHAPSRFSVLHHAARRGDLVIVEQLLAGGANVDKRSHSGSTPLYEAVLAGHLHIARALIAGGAETRATTNDGHSALDAARARGDQRLIDLMATLPEATVRSTFRGKREWS